MKIDISKTLCTMGIVVLLVILMYATYIKNTYTTKNDTSNQNVNVNQNNNLTNETNQNNNIQNSEQDNNEKENTTPEIKTLKCYSIYYDEKTTKANIKEEIIITFENDKAIKQEQKFNYSFEQVVDYNNLKTKFDSEEQQDNIQTNYDQTTNTIERIISSDYSMGAVLNDLMDFRNHKFEDVKTDLQKQQFICN